MNRALRAATMGVLLFSPLALSACSAGQVTQTVEQERDKVGAMAEAGDIVLRQIAVVAPEDGEYPVGEDAPLRLAIVNTGTEDDTLTGITGEGFDDVEIDAAATSATPSAQPPGTGAGSTEDESTSAGAGELVIPAGTTVFVGGDGDSAVTLTGLDEALTSGRILELTFTFENAGEVTTVVPVAALEEVRERDESFDFHHEEEGESGGGVEEGGHEQTEVAGGGNPEN
ncbi:copper chaperone PCu(A)C [Blastococcus sp. KM273129]|uniref:copper chaperone PCu(A)C n=1 Tax=Blastococcus sp. KM273129 TaxID=2570315 RepID=UPI001F385F44|nr:copper chaperone PCu(A)C [Blastococcus sp. KM273129]MCF6736991.1 copper chaperone PCu(A)C [Blastococcus sp. KM273129]